MIPWSLVCLVLLTRGDKQNILATFTVWAWTIRGSPAKNNRYHQTPVGAYGNAALVSKGY